MRSCIRSESRFLFYFTTFFTEHSAICVTSSRTQMHADQLDVAWMLFCYCHVVCLALDVVLCYIARLALNVVSLFVTLSVLR